MTDIDRLCRHHGITLDYGHPVPDATKRLLLSRLGVDAGGQPDGPPAQSDLRAPDHVSCFLPDSLASHPGWGMFCQLYELRSDRNWGIGDFRDLADMARIAGASGADFLGINPLHALFPTDPERASPFSPSNRQMLNPLYIAVDDVPGWDGVEPEALAGLRARETVHYTGVTRVKMATLRRLFDAHPPQDAAFDAFVTDRGAPLLNHARHEALALHLAERGAPADWRHWPEEFRDPASESVAAFTGDHADDIRFQLWLQWLADTQLADAAKAAHEAGMRIGLYLDLAVGVHPGGSSTWSGQGGQMEGLSIGAPPDMFSTEGQNWGLAAPSPTEMLARDLEPFRAVIAAQLHHGGALRIDHAMALWQLFLIPDGERPSAGTHLRYPLDAMLRVLADESHRHRAVVIGEDLGFVPDGFREAMAASNLLAYRVLVFEQDDTRLRPMAAYPERAIACVSTHDLPVLARWWTGADIDLRQRLGVVADSETEGHRHARAAERRSLCDLLVAEGALEQRPDPQAETLPGEVLVATHAMLAGAPSLLVALRLADLVGPEEPTNVPGTDTEHPNWRARSAMPLAEIGEDLTFRSVTSALRHRRPRPD